MTTIVTIGYFYQCFKNLKLPFIQTNQNSNVKENSMITNPRKDITLVIFGIAFMFLSYGIDMYFQSQIYVFGLCGPLKLSPEYAGWLNTTYFANYLLGRLISIPLSTLLAPNSIISLSLLGKFHKKRRIKTII